MADLFNKFGILCTVLAFLIASLRPIVLAWRKHDPAVVDYLAPVAWAMIAIACFMASATLTR